MARCGLAGVPPMSAIASLGPLGRPLSWVKPDVSCTTCNSVGRHGAGGMRIPVTAVSFTKRADRRPVA